MPFTVDEERFRKQHAFDVSKPQGFGTDSIPVKQIPHLEFPRVVYKHPAEPFYKVEHRNTRHEVVDVEMVPSAHLTMAVANEAELAKALKEGWSKKPYIAAALPDVNAELYEVRK